jgi:hypothetical protein
MTLLRAYWDAALTTDPDETRAARGANRSPYSRPAELHELFTRTGLDAVEVGELVVGADYDDLDDAWWPFAIGKVGRSGAYCSSLDEPAREALKAEFGRRLGSPDGPFHLTARAWYARGTTTT